ncbi:glucose transporter [Liberibacter crescens]|nr:glucose transporter [Liberibacter crescens]
MHLKVYVFILFFVFGGITSLNDILIPKLKELFSLSYSKAMLIQSAFFASYFFISVPCGLLVRKYGYMRSACVGLSIMAVGCLCFILASKSVSFFLFLFALCILASGITMVQVVSNPLISLLGDPLTTASRLTFAQAFNSLGTTIAPYIGAIIILNNLSNVDVSSMSAEDLYQYRIYETSIISDTYFIIATVLLGISLLIWFQRNSLSEKNLEAVSFIKSLELLKNFRFLFGSLCIFLYVGAEVSVGSMMVNYLMREDTLSLNGVSAGKHAAMYWGSAMIGRFIGSWFLTHHSAGKILAFTGSMASLLLLISASSYGWISGWSLIAIGLFNSIMFPTIFSLANFGLGSRAPEGSGLICMAIVGGAIVPLITGYVADISNLKVALLVPVFCYLNIALYGWLSKQIFAKT